MQVVLFLSVLLIAACGLIYELIAGTLASYLLGDSVLQFSTVIGSYLFAMGVGSYLSRHITRGLVGRFVEIELMVGRSSQDIRLRARVTLTGKARTLPKDWRMLCAFDVTGR